MKLSEKLKSTRISKNLTQTQMCELVGVSYATYNKLENLENYEPSIETVNKLASFFNTSVEKIRRML